MSNSTLTPVKSRPGVFRINHGPTNATLTKHGGFVAPKTYGRILTAAGLKLEDAIHYNVEFRRGNESKHWYARVYKLA